HVYRHGDAGHLEALLAGWRRRAPAGTRALVVTDSIFSMDGDLAPLPALVAACETHDAVLMGDEAHATGVIGPGGRGGVAHFGPAVIGEADVAMGLSARLLEAGVLVTAIRPPSVPPGTSRLRATVMATHSEAQIDRAVAAFAAARPPGP